MNETNNRVITPPERNYAQVLEVLTPKIPQPEIAVTGPFNFSAPDGNQVNGMTLENGIAVAVTVT